MQRQLRTYVTSLMVIIYLAYQIRTNPATEFYRRFRRSSFVCLEKAYVPSVLLIGKLDEQRKITGNKIVVDLHSTVWSLLSEHPLFKYSIIVIRFVLFYLFHFCLFPFRSSNLFPTPITPCCS